MGEVAINQTVPQKLGGRGMQDTTSNEMETNPPESYPSNGKCVHLEESKDDRKSSETLEKGYMQYG